MAIVPGESIMDNFILKPSSFVVWCLLCKVKTAGCPDCYLDIDYALRAGVKKSACFHAFNELAGNGWIEFSRKFGGKKYWKLVKGFAQNSTNAEFQAETPADNSANVENNDKKSANVETKRQILSANVENSTNADKSDAQNSTNADSHIRNNSPLPQNSNEFFGEEEEEEWEDVASQKKSKAPNPSKSRIPTNFSVSVPMRLWAKNNVPEINVDHATDDFIEYWENLEGAKATRVDWVKTWKKGMRLAVQWQQEANQNGKFKPNQTGGKNGNGIAKRDNQSNNFETGNRQQRDERAINDYNTVESARRAARERARIAKLQTGDAADN